MQQEEQNQEEPTISASEMKMPEGFTSSEEDSDNTTHLGIILGVLIVLLILILGGLYLWGTTFQTASTTITPTIERPTIEENDEPESTNAEAEVETLGALSTSNEIDAITADIESTNLDELDAELEAIDAELNAALQSI